MENLQKPVRDELVALATAEASNRSLRKKRDLEIELARAIERTSALDVGERKRACRSVVPTRAQCTSRNRSQGWRSRRRRRDCGGLRREIGGQSHRPAGAHPVGPVCRAAGATGTTCRRRTARSDLWASRRWEDKVAQRAILLLLEPIYEARDPNADWCADF